MRCPRCHQTLDLAQAVCRAGHTFPVENAVLVLMDEAQRAHVKAIYRHREQVQTQLPPITDYDRLPYALVSIRKIRFLVESKGNKTTFF